MTAVRDMSVHRETLNRLGSELAGSRHSWVRDLRKQNLDHFESLGYPTNRLEAWKKLNLRPITAGHFELATSAGLLTEPLSTPLSPYTLCFLDGHLSPEHSTMGDLPPGLSVRSLAAVLNDNDAESVSPLFNQAATDTAHPFLALNGALFTDGAVIEVESLIAEPVALRFIQTKSAEPRGTHTRVFVRVAANAAIEFVEEFLGIGGHFTNHVTEVTVGQNGSVRHIRLQDESETGLHMGVAAYSLERDARLDSHAISIGAALSRVDGLATFLGEGAEASLRGLYMLEGDQVCDHHTVLHHRVPHTHSKQLYKGILGESARAIFNGQVTIDKDAQKTTADQQNPNLLLSDRALVNTNPQLEIYADDVQCRHGATVGQMDEDSLFYLRSRGIPKEEAVRLLIRAFAAEIVDALPGEAVRDHVSERIRERFFSRV